MGNADRPTARMHGEDLRSGKDKLVTLADLFPRPGLKDGVVEIGHGQRRLPCGGAEFVERLCAGAPQYPLPSEHSWRNSSADLPRPWRTSEN